MYDLLISSKILLVGAALLAASIQDVKTREVSDKIWGAAMPIGAALTVLEVLSKPGYPYMLALLSASFSVALAFGIYYARLYGGADAKALAAIAVTMPLPPYGYLNASPFFPLTVLGNGILLSLSLILVCLAWNTWSYLRGAELFSGMSVKGWEKAVALLIGIRVRPSTAESVHFNLMERAKEDGTKGFRFIHKLEDELEEEADLQREAKAPRRDEDDEREGSELEGISEEVKTPENYNYVWVTPSIPMIVFLLAGYILYFLAGDLVFRTVLALLQPF
ncbi:MAG: A24 family peptidase C-terminal domain-containing protein [Candidatus Methanomethylicaceae archaeon]